MADGMRPRRQLREQECGDEKEMAQRIHGAILTPMSGTRVRGVQQAAANAQTPIVDLRRRRRNLRRPGSYSLKIQLAITK